MSEAKLEHVNMTVADAKTLADTLVRLFGWTIRWEGKPDSDGYTVHVGSEASYLALYTPNSTPQAATKRYAHLNALNHIGIVVADLDKAEARVVAEGYKITTHADYEPGRRFYFLDGNGIEFEVVSYDN